MKLNILFRNVVALEVNFNAMQSINPRFTCLLYLLAHAKSAS